MAIPAIAQQKIDAAQVNIGWAKGFAQATATNQLLAYCRAFCEYVIADVQYAAYVLAYASPVPSQPVFDRFSSAVTNATWAKAFAVANANATSKSYARAFCDLAYSDLVQAEFILASDSPDERTDWSPTNIYAAPASGDFPNSSNSGLANASVLTPTGGFSCTPGATYENLDVSGQVVLASGVTLRNCRVRANDYYVVRNLDGITGVLMEDCEFDGLGGICNAVLGGGGGSWTGKRLYIHGGEDALKLTSGCVLRDSRLTGNAGSAADPHYDGIQIIAGVNMQIIHNYIELPQLPGETSAIFMKPDFVGFPISHVTIRYNYLNGGGFTVQHANGPAGNPTNVHLQYNRFGPRHGYGQLRVEGTLASNVGNVYT